jgi:DNA-binding NarL/FixJ family response regulator
MGAHAEDSPGQECGYPYRRNAVCVPPYGHMTKTVLIVDDHPSFRVTARALLEAEGFEVVGEAADGTSALELARKLRPDVLLLDVQLPDLDGFEVAGKLSQNGWSPAIVLTSSRDLSDFGSLVAQCGARGFVPKAELSAETLSALLE